ncbi:MAG: hypothetical protein ACRD6W_18670 [Nitrososphaerales archaeon]
MRLKRLARLEKARRVATSFLAVALVFAFAYGISGLVTNHRSAAFALSANKDFGVSSTVYATTCTKTSTAKLSPGMTRCLAVSVTNPLSVDIDVTALSMTVSFTPTKTNHDTPACKATWLRVTRTLPHTFTVTAKTAHTVDEQIQLTTTPNTTQGACVNGRFTFSFLGSSHYTDTTATTLLASLTGRTKAVLTATVSPANPTTIPYGPATAPTKVVDFYSCKTKACITRTRTLVATEPLTTSHKTTKSATATDTVTSLRPGVHYFDAVYSATGTNPGTFEGSTSAIEPVTVITTLPAVCKGKTFTHFTIFPIFPVVYGTYQSTLIVVGNANFTIYGFQGTDCVVAGDGNNLVYDGTGDDGIEAGYGNNNVFLGNGSDEVLLGNGTNLVVAGKGMDTVKVGNGPFDKVALGNGTDTVTEGYGWNDRVKIGDGTDMVTVGNGENDQIKVGNGTDTVTITTPGSYDTIYAGTGTETIYLGAGTYNTFKGISKTKDTCFVPKPTKPYQGTPARYYHDTVTNCTVMVTT